MNVNQKKIETPKIAFMSLEKRNLKLLSVSVIVATLVHIAVISGTNYVSLLGTVTKVHKVKFAPEPEIIPTMEYPVPKPLLSKSFEFRKIQVPQYSAVIVRPSAAQATWVQGGGGGIGEIQVPTGYTISGRYSYGVGVRSGTGIGATIISIPQFERVNLVTTKEPEKRISMHEELLDLRALDMGKYKGMVIQDPLNKQNVSGFVHIGLAVGNTLSPPTLRAIPQLVKAINTYTRIRAVVDNRIPLDSRELFKAPFVYITENKAFELTSQEIKNLATYLRSGGFALVDNSTPTLEYGPAKASLRKMLKQVLGKDARFLMIPNDYPIYHCFFEFNDGPPPGADAGTWWGSSAYLEGIFLEGRLVAVYSDKGYGLTWEKDYKNEPQLKMGVNLVVFALTQRGSIAEQQINFYSGK